MIEISNWVDPLLADKIEEYFCEEENINWTIVQKTEGENHRLLGYFDDQDSAYKGWSTLKIVFPTIGEAPQIRSIAEEDWQNSYKQYLKPWNYQHLHWVPVWERDTYQVPQSHSVVWLDAGMAFGTGAHETTQLCAIRILQYIQEFSQTLHQKNLIDAGCGSGILAISAKILGFGSVMGFDNDPEAVRISNENMHSNSVNPPIHFEVANLEQVFPTQKADLIVANILANVLASHRAILLNSVNPGGRLILSGILKDEVSSLQALFEHDASSIWGDFQFESTVLGEWADLYFKRPLSSL